MRMLIGVLVLAVLSTLEATTLEDAKQIEAWITTIRRDLHQIPEIGFEEEKTSKYIRSKLDELKIKYEYPIAKTGIVARIGSGKPMVALRTDMDALPIKEEVESDFKSKHEGKMHACGHDGHMSMLLGAAKLLKEKESDLQGTVLLVFQPAEEGLAGAKQVVESGALKGVSAIHGLHLWPTIKSGVFASKVGVLMAGSTSFRFTIEGQGGHAAMPHLTRDPVVAAAAIVQDLQFLVSRVTSPTNSVVISVTQFSTGEGATNVIPDEVHLGGTLRALTEEELLNLIDRIEQVASKMAEAHGCKVKNIQWRTPHYPPTVNSAETTAAVEHLAKQLVGDTNWMTLEAPTMGGEDFSFFAREIPATFTWLGNDNEKEGILDGLHTNRFQVDESILHLGAALHTDFALHHLSNSASTGSHGEL